MSGIAAELGGSKGTLWSHFPSKSELFAAALDDATESFQYELRHELFLSGELDLTVRRFCDRLCQRMSCTSGLALHRLLVSETLRQPELGTIYFERVYKPTAELLASYFDDCIARKQMRDQDTGQAARALLRLCLGFLHERLLYGDVEVSPAEIAENATQAAEMFLRSYAIERSWTRSGSD